MRQDVKDLIAEYNRTEEDLKAIQSVGQLIGDVLKQVDEEAPPQQGGVFSAKCNEEEPPTMDADSP